MVKTDRNKNLKHPPRIWKNWENIEAYGKFVKYGKYVRQKISENPGSLGENWGNIGHSVNYVITINVPVVYMARDVII